MGQTGQASRQTLVLANECGCRDDEPADGRSGREEENIVKMLSRHPDGVGSAAEPPQLVIGRDPVSTTKPVEELSEPELATELTESAWRVQAAILLDIPNKARELAKARRRRRDLRNERARRWGMKPE